jgi:DNA-binding SARP family transcriptional activator/TolB-like protein/tetratricopeptide (TPR) repeat protein
MSNAAATDVEAGLASRRLDSGRPTRPILRVHLVGPMRAITYLGENVIPRGKKARAMLGRLCLAPGGTLPRAGLAAMLWDTATPGQARSRFRRALGDLRAALGALGDELIFADQETIALTRGACWIDALALIESPAPDSNRCDLAALCAGELLEGLEGTSASFDRWLAEERTSFSHRLRGFLESELHRGEQSGPQARQVAAVSRRLLAFDATHEGSAFTETTHASLAAQPGQAGLTRSNSARNNRLRVGVLPFDARRSKNERNLGFSLSHEIAAALARFRWFDVITPVSMMRRPLANFVGDDLRRHERLDYAVDGTIAVAGKHIEISVRLLDLAERTRPAWSDRFTLEMNELHKLNEMVVGRIVASIDPIILFIEGRPRGKDRYGASGLLFLAIPLIYSMERNKFQQAGELIEQALMIEPDNSMAVTLAAYWHLWHIGQGWTSNAKRTLTTVESLCLTAMQLDPENADAMGIYAHTLSWKREYDSALHFFDRALRLNPNLAYIWALSAAAYCYIGEPENALKRLGRYLDLAPLDPYLGFFEGVYTIAYTVKRDYEKAVVVGRRVVKSNPQFINGYKPLIASLGHLGRRDEAAPHLAKLLSLEPEFTVQSFVDTYPFKFARDLENYADGLRRAGVREG